MTVTNKEIVIPDDTLPTSQGKAQLRELTLNGLIHGMFWHRIDIKDVFEVRSKNGNVIKKWEEKNSHKVYTFKEAGGEFTNLPSEVYWMSLDTS